MCQSKADGGRRCASHTRAALRRAHKTLGGPDNWPQPGITYPPDSPQARFRQALTNHAATPTGRRELQHKLDHETNPDRRAELTTALNGQRVDTGMLDQTRVVPLLLRDPGSIDPYDQHDWDAELSAAVRDKLRDTHRSSSDVSAADLADAATRAVASWHRLDLGRRRWVPLLEPQRLSGHKLHVAAADLADVRGALRRVFPVCHRAGLGLKAAADSPTLSRNDGKGLTIYLTRRDTIHRDTSLVAASLRGYRVPGVHIAGDTHLAGSLWHRYEFTHDPGQDVPVAAAHSLYRPSLQALRHAVANGGTRR